MRRTIRGSSVSSCLLLLVFVLGGGLWFYCKFIQYRDFPRAGRAESIIVEAEDNRLASLEYQRVMRERLLGSTEAQVRHCRVLLAQARAGKWRTGFEQRHNQVLQELHQSLNELNAHRVPPRFVRGHLLLGAAHRDCYEALQLTAAGVAGQASAFAEAEKLLRRAAGEATQGTAFIRAGVR